MSKRIKTETKPESDVVPPEKQTSATKLSRLQSSDVYDDLRGLKESIESGKMSSREVAKFISGKRDFQVNHWAVLAHARDLGIKFTQTRSDAGRKLHAGYASRIGELEKRTSELEKAAVGQEKLILALQDTINRLHEELHSFVASGVKQ